MPNDGTPPVGTGAPAAAIPATPPAPPAIAPPAAVTPPAPVAAADPPGVDPTWLATRLERAKGTGREGLLKELGADSLDAAKAAIAAAKAADEAKKSAEQRALEASNKVTQTEQALARTTALLKEQAGRMMMVLTQDQQKAVTEFAGEDPQEQLRAIHHFAPLWAKAAATSTDDAEMSDEEIAKLETDLAEVKAARAGKQPAVSAPPAASPPPANTAPPPGAPPGNAPGSPPDHRAVYSQLTRTNPFKAAAYGLQNFGAVHTKT